MYTALQSQKTYICLLVAEVDTAFWLSTAAWLSLGTDYRITFTPPFVSKDLNKLNTPSFEGALHIEIVVRLFCLPLNHYFKTFLYFLYDKDLVIFAKF